MTRTILTAALVCLTAPAAMAQTAPAPAPDEAQTAPLEQTVPVRRTSCGRDKHVMS
ncbi:hypothetical protein [Paracoccus rhizosphaerae]|uniref:Uncharacterized protein n=1 Tax=Paracoccus rhizosphaerae TaxID=1133347 RepID=A0ABV6CFL8_9RHOB|nr:hypothetical protein [Paracoccus rhizosphaerae]MEE2859995.1 hypothetical protein [Pseudomonadota bacterium]